MDGTVVSAPSSPLLDWITQYGNYVAFFAQIIYWLAMIVLIAYAVAQYKRWVNYQLGTGKSGRLRTDLPQADDAIATAKAEKSDDAIDVEEFVE